MRTSFVNVATSTLRPNKVGQRQALGLEQTREFIDSIFGDDAHAMRVLSLANGVVGVLNAAVLSIHAIGQAYAHVAKIKPKSGTKQVDRMLSNSALRISELLPSWIAFVVASRPEVVIALDWTDFDDDDHATLCAYLMTSHGRATPLLWKTALKSGLKGRRTAIEQSLLTDLRGWLPENVAVTLLADRGFGDSALYWMLGSWGWDYAIRFRGCIHVTSEDGEKRTAAEWMHASGRARILRNVRVTHASETIPAVVVTRDKGMKDAWCLATSHADWSAKEVAELYAKRFTIEQTFRDTKDLHFGMGLSATHIRDADRRDRLLLLVAIAHALLTLLGAAAEDSGLDRYLKANTVKRRTHSLFRQGTYWYGCIPDMRIEWLRDLMSSFDRIVREHALFTACFGII